MSYHSPSNCVAVDGLAAVQPGDEPSRLVRRVAFVQVTPDERHVLPVVEVRRGRTSVLVGSEGFSSKPTIRVVLVELDDAVVRRQLEVAAVVDREGASDALHLPECGKTVQLEVEQVVAGDHEQVVVAPGALQHERDVADRAEPVFVRESAVVVDGDTAAAGRPAAEVVREAAVGDEVDVVD